MKCKGIPEFYYKTQVHNLSGGYITCGRNSGGGKKLSVKSEEVDEVTNDEQDDF